MRILIDIGHPGHVHLFRPFSNIMLEKGHTILFTCRQKEFEIELLRSAKFDYICFGKHFNTKTGKIWGLFKFNAQMLLTSLKYRPDIFLSHGSIYAAQVAWLLGKPHVSMEDSGNMEQIRLYRPFTKAILTPTILPEKLGSKQIRYNSFHEIAYLSPSYFLAEKKVINLLTRGETEQYCILRFVSWKATHDHGQSGFSPDYKMRLISLLEKRFKVFISSEGKLPDNLKEYQIILPPEDLHHALAYAELVISEGATIASESGVLGTPSVYINSIITSNNEEQEKYGTVFNFRSEVGIIEKVEEILSIPEYKNVWRKRSEKLLAEKIDLTQFLVWFIEDWPNSFKIMKENPDYQYRFK